MSTRPCAAHLDDMTDQTQTAQGQNDADFNARQWNIINFAIRKSASWHPADFDARVAIITKPGSDRSLALYPSGTTRRGVRVAIIDGSSTGPRFITQAAAWTLLAEATL